MEELSSAPLFPRGRHSRLIHVFDLAYKFPPDAVSDAIIPVWNQH